jgi:hypothetical protein
VKISELIQKYCPLAFFLFLTTLSLFLLLWAKREMNEADAMTAAANRISVTISAGIPILSQNSVDVAMAIYGIEVGPNIDAPALDLNLEDRGLTSRGALSARSMITVGPAAFSTWALLGSTLAHEIEIHGRQNFLAISMLDLLRLDGTAMAERQAYRHEINSSARFGLDTSDKLMIAETMEFFYPEKRRSVAQHHFSARVQKWFSRNILREHVTL